MASMDTAEYLQHLLTHKNNVLAPWIAGPAVDLFAAGIYCSMLFKYFSNKPRGGHGKLTLLVYIVALLSAYKTATALYILFLNAVILNGDRMLVAIAAFQNWAMITAPLTTHIVDWAVQAYYISLLNRLFSANNGHWFHSGLRWGLLCLITTSMILSTVFGILAVYEVLTFRYLNVTTWLTCQLAIAFFGDFLVSGGTIYWLLKTDNQRPCKRSAFSQFAWMMAMSASIPALCALLNIAIVTTGIYYNRWHVFFDFALSKAYAISLMWSIEARQQLIVRRSTWLEEGSKYIRPRGPNPGHPRTSRLITASMFATTMPGHTSKLDYPEIAEVNKTQRRLSPYYASPPEDFLELRTTTHY